MQVIILDKYFKCIYRLRNIPKEWKFEDVAFALHLPRDPESYESYIINDDEDLCIDDWKYKDGKLIITDAICS